MTFIIAEVGSNWHTKEDCLNAIDAAHRCGADAVKFQLFDHEAMFGFPDESAPHKNWFLPKEWLKELATYCDGKLEFMCTPFSPEGAKLIDPLVKRHKVASSDMEYLELLELLTTFKKPIYLSTGGHSFAEVRAVVRMLPQADLTLLYCEATYPSVRHDLRKMWLLEELGFPVGYSDHSNDVFWAPWSAVCYFGATVLEKHFNPLGLSDTPDAGHSLSQREFLKMVEILRKRDELPEELLSHDEKDMRLMHNRRLIVTKPIKKGEAFQYGVNFGAFRSKTPVVGVSPVLAEEIEGKIADRWFRTGEAVPQGYLCPSSKSPGKENGACQA